MNPDYSPLREVLDLAYAQAADGKGRERHAGGKDFLRQPIMEIGRMTGPGFHAGQAQKKLQEALTMISRGQSDAAVAELLGAIIYTSACVMLVRELHQSVPIQAVQPGTVVVNPPRPRVATPTVDMSALETALRPAG